ncbi:MAG: hypothetical protein ACE5FB_00775 [Candidatus Binatia bacterium]
MIALMPSSVTTPVTEYEDTVRKETRAQWSPFVPILSNWQTQALRALFQIATLPHNWDSYGSPPLSPTSLATSIDLLSEIDLDDLPIPHVAPVPGGGVQFEWSVGQRELEFEILRDGSVEFLKVDSKQPVEEGQLRYVDQMFSLLSWLTSG